jgi:hypothetical protein
MSERAEKRTDRRKEKGQSMVEFALVLPLFLIVMFIIVDFGVGFSRWLVITNAAREGARFGSVGASPAEVVDRTIRTSHGLLDAGGVTVEYADFEGDGVGPGDAVVVNAEYGYGLITPIGQIFDSLAGSITLSSCADMRIEQDVSDAADSGAEC